MYTPDINMFTSTWLNDSVCDNSIELADYDLFSHDRTLGGTRFVPTDFPFQCIYRIEQFCPHFSLYKSTHNQRPIGCESNARARVFTTTSERDQPRMKFRTYLISPAYKTHLESDNVHLTVNSRSKKIKPSSTLIPGLEIQLQQFLHW